jgi:hypothetical protein
VRRFLVMANVVPISPIRVTLMTEALSSSETSVLTRVTQHTFPEDSILHSRRRENLKSYSVLFHSGHLDMGFKNLHNDLNVPVYVLRPLSRAYSRDRSNSEFCTRTYKICQI